MGSVWSRSTERALADVPRAVKVVLVVAFGVHVAWQLMLPAPEARAHALGTPAPVEIYRVASLGETIAASQLVTLYLQAFDNQPGISVPFRELDYAAVTEWLALALQLDPRTQYPLMLAAHVYGHVSDEPRQRLMFDFVHRQFLEDPDRRWRWLAHAAIVAKHRLKDTPLALRYAEEITRHAGAAMGWARQMRIFILADMGEVEAAAVLLGGLLESGEVKDPAEIRFLTERLEELKSTEKSVPAPGSR